MTTELWASISAPRGIVNLVMNSVKYTRGKGATITLSNRVEGDSVFARVADKRF